MIDFEKVKSRALAHYDTAVADLPEGDEEVIARARAVLADAEELGGVRNALQLLKHELLVEAGTGIGQIKRHYEVCACASRAVGHAYCVCEAELAELEAPTDADGDSDEDEDVIDAVLTDVTIDDVVPEYDGMNADDAIASLEHLELNELRFVRAHEADNKNRKTVLRAIDAKLED